MFAIAASFLMGRSIVSGFQKRCAGGFGASGLARRNVYSIADSVNASVACNASTICAASYPASRQRRTMPRILWYDVMGLGCAVSR